MQFFAPPNPVYHPAGDKDDPEVVRLWNDMNRLPTPEGRQQAFASMQQYVLEQVYAVPFGSFTKVQGVRSNVQGLHPIPHSPHGRRVVREVIGTRKPLPLCGRGRRAQSAAGEVNGSPPVHLPIRKRKTSFGATRSPSPSALSRHRPLPLRGRGCVTHDLHHPPSLGERLPNPADRQPHHLRHDPPDPRRSGRAIAGLSASPSKSPTSATTSCWISR